MNVYEAIFPTQKLEGTLEQTAGALWRRLIGTERLVDSKTRRISAPGGAPAYEVLVATVDAQNRGIYRVFVFKQYERSVAVGELRFDDLDRMKAIGEPAVASLENMSARHDRRAARGGLEVSNQRR